MTIYSFQLSAGGGIVKARSFISNLWWLNPKLLLLYSAQLIEYYLSPKPKPQYNLLSEALRFSGDQTFCDDGIHDALYSYRLVGL